MNASDLLDVLQLATGVYLLIVGLVLWAGLLWLEYGPATKEMRDCIAQEAEIVRVLQPKLLPERTGS